MVDDAQNKASEKTTEKPSVGFTLPFAERAPTNPMDVMAAATAAGMALSTQFASAFFGMMQAAMETTARSAETTARSAKSAAPAEQSKPDAPRAEVKPEVKVAPKVEAPVSVEPEKVPVAAAVPQAEPVAKAKPVKTAARKTKAAGTDKVMQAKAEAPAKPAPKKTTSAPRKAAVTETKPVEPKARPASARKAKAGADLKRISGIGPKLEGMLNAMGVKSVKDIAAWSEDDVAHFDRELGLDGRIAKDNWIAQAQALLR
jgi:NADH-quinone oxidoreductase subunit E